VSVVTGYWYTPPEVYEIAARVRAIAQKVRAQYTPASQVKNQLDQTWYGNAKNIFDGNFQGFPQAILNYSDELKQMADEILGIRWWVDIGSEP
jgi:WXG100 family type VII secretion target